MDTKIDSTRAIDVPATALLTRPLAFITGHTKLWLTLLTILVAGATVFFWWGRRGTADDYVTDKVTRGTVEVSVSATGTVQAGTTVQVGSQVSGTLLSLAK